VGFLVLWGSLTDPLRYWLQWPSIHRPSEGTV
jgi:hypothetical protein